MKNLLYFSNNPKKNGKKFGSFAKTIYLCIRK